jgi:hypothetical protein
MEIFANGKNIPTYAFGNLFIQGENFADTICFVIDRYYNGRDLMGCNFLIRGVTEENWEVNQILFGEADGDKIRLEWNVVSDFTYNSGTLSLELSASAQNEYGNEYTVIKFDMSPIYVKPTIRGKNGPLPETSEQVLNKITEAASNGLGQIRQEIADFNLEAVKTRLDKMERDTATYLARPEVAILTQRQYDAITHEESVIYAIVEEE